MISGRITQAAQIATNAGITQPWETRLAYQARIPAGRSWSAALAIGR
jgi:hypothetical protein